MIGKALLGAVAILASAGAAAQPVAPPPPLADKAPPLSAEVQAQVERSRMAGERFAAFMKGSRETASSRPCGFGNAADICAPSSSVFMSLVTRPSRNCTASEP